jgi:hypothetical protein
MKTSTKVKIGVSILLSVLLLALIGQKKKESFRNREAFTTRANASPNEMVSLNTDNGYDIDGYTPNILMEIKEKKCKFNTLTDKERELEIQKNVNEQQNQLNEYLNREIKSLERKEKSNIESAKLDPNTCYLQFPAIL